MDSSKDLVSAILQQGPGAYRKTQEQLQSSYLNGEGKVAFDFLTGYFSAYGALPPREIILAKTGVVLEATPVADAQFYITELVNGHLQVKLKESFDATSKLLDKWQPQEAFALIEDELRKIRSSQIVGSKVVPISSLAKAVWERYELIESGATGILTPWPLMNEATLGFWPQDLILLVARVGIGKTWTQAQLALQAWQDGHKVLFATTEMKPERIAQRIYALKLGINYTEFTHGKLGTFAREAVKAKLLEAAASDGVGDLLHVVGGDFDFQIGNFEAAIDQVQPKLVLLDGAYLLRVAGANRIERAANAFDELKRLANRMSVPIVVTMQFNREVKANQANTVKTESIALTDVASWNADLIYGLIQTEDMKAEKKVIFKNLKAREGVGEDFECNWDLDTMNFKQIGKLMKNGVGGGDADEGGGSYSSGKEAPF